MSLLDIIKSFFIASASTSDIPEDSMLRRHYLQNLEAQKAAK